MKLNIKMKLRPDGPCRARVKGGPCKVLAPSVLIKNHIVVGPIEHVLYISLTY